MHGALRGAFVFLINKTAFIIYGVNAFTDLFPQLHLKHVIKQMAETSATFSLTSADKKRLGINEALCGVLTFNLVKTTRTGLNLTLPVRLSALWIWPQMTFFSTN